MIEVFKTNVRTKKHASKILPKLSIQYPTAKINFDLDDCDKILRVESEEIIANDYTNPSMLRLSMRNFRMTNTTKRNINFIAVALSLLTFILMRQQSTNDQTNSNADKIIGGWISDAKDCQREIIKSGNQYIGKLIKGWGNEIYETDGKTLRRDTRNPNAKLRNRTLLNMEFISNLIFVNGKYEEGKLYVAQIVKSVRCTMKFEGDKLIMRAYVGFPFLGITEKWSRVRS